MWKYYAVAEDAHPWHDAAAPRYREQALYDLSSDPHELSTLIGLRSHREQAALPHERLARRITEAGEAEPVIEPAPEHDPGGQLMTDPAVRLGGPVPVRFGHQPPRTA